MTNTPMLFDTVFRAPSILSNPANTERTISCDVIPDPVELQIARSPSVVLSPILAVGTHMSAQRLAAGMIKSGRTLAKSLILLLKNIDMDMERERGSKLGSVCDDPIVP